MDEIVGLAVDALRKRIERAEEAAKANASARSSQPVTPALTGTPSQPSTVEARRAPSRVLAARVAESSPVAPAPHVTPAALGAFADSRALLAALVLSEALAPPIARRPR